VSARTLLIIDDEPQVLRFLRSSLASTGYKLIETATGAAGLAAAAAQHPDVILLDLGLPDLDGIEVARRLREWTETPIIILSARGQERDKIAALDAGADDYLTKPFDLDELFARLRALLRRGALLAGAAKAAETGTDRLGYDNLTMDLGTREITRAGRSIELTRTEFSLLEMFLRHPRQVLAREQLLSSIWGFDFGPTSNSLDVYVMYLRRKTEAGGEPRLLHTVRGVGYVLRADAAMSS
jgi:two-component system, OmpR family, response regulator MprA